MYISGRKVKNFGVSGSKGWAESAPLGWIGLTDLQNSSLDIRGQILEPQLKISACGLQKLGLIL